MLDPCPEIIQPWWKWYPYVGTFIGILAGMGVLIPWFRGANIGRREKEIWSAITVALVALELRSITLDGRQHDRDQQLANCRQLESFKEIGNGITEAINSGRQVSTKLDTLNDFVRRPYEVSLSARQQQQRNAATEKTIESLRDSAAGNQKAYLKAIALNINNALRSLLARSGNASKLTFDPKGNAATLSNIGYIPQNVGNAATQWFETEMRLTTSSEESKTVVSEAIAQGEKILKDVEAVPMATQIVVDFDIPLCAEISCKTHLNGVGVMLDEISPEGTHNVRVFPTTNIGYYKKGMSVTWEWDLHFVWSQAYYIDKTSGMGVSAFTSSADFVGRDLNQVLVTKN